MNKPDDVLVVDAYERFVGYVHWAVARRALRDKRARMFRRNPYVIMLPPGVTKLPSFGVAEGDTMHNSNTYPSGQSVSNWFTFFQNERELWVQNTSATQLSIQFEIAPGHFNGVLVPISPDPVCITNEVPFESVKKSLDFRKFLNRVPAVMKLLTTEQAHEYYAQKAKNLNAYITDPATGRLVPNIAAAIEHTELERKRLTTRPAGDDTVVGPDGQVRFSPPKSAQELMNMNAEQHMGVPAGAAQAAGLTQVPQGFANAPGFVQQAQGNFNPAAAGFANVGSAPVMMEQLINPRVLYLCQQVSMQLPANQRMAADEFWRQLRSLESALKIEDFQYIESNGTYKTVKKWARECQQKLIAAGQGDGVDDGLEDTPMGVV